MKLVRERYGKLHSIVDTLTTKTKRLLLRERRDYLAAYRAHTSEIHSQLVDLRQRVAEERASCQTQGKLNELRDENDWFRAEALRLIKHGNAKQEELHKLREQLEAAESDRDWLRTKLAGLRDAQQRMPPPVARHDPPPTAAAPSQQSHNCRGLVDRRNEVLLRIEVLKKDCTVLRHILATRQSMGGAPLSV